MILSVIWIFLASSVGKYHSSTFESRETEGLIWKCEIHQKICGFRHASFHYMNVMHYFSWSKNVSNSKSKATGYEKIEDVSGQLFSLRTDHTWKAKSRNTSPFPEITFFLTSQDDLRACWLTWQNSSYWTFEACIPSRVSGSTWQCGSCFFQSHIWVSSPYEND